MGRYDNQKQTILLEFGQNQRGDLKRVSLKENPTKKDGTAGSKTFDLRSCYTDANGDIQYTQKGITIGEEDWAPVLASLISNIGYEDIEIIEEALSKRKIELKYDCDDIEEEEENI